MRDSLLEPPTLQRNFNRHLWSRIPGGAVAVEIANYNMRKISVSQCKYYERFGRGLYTECTVTPDISTVMSQLFLACIQI